MIRLLFALVMVALIANANAQYDRPDLNQFRERVAISIQSHDDIQRLINAEIDLDYCSDSDGKTVYAYATPEEVKVIEYLGYTSKPAPTEIGRDAADASYHTYDTLTSDLKAFETAYPNLAMVKALGQSVDNRTIWALKISDNVTVDEAEPEVKYVSTMHGDEVVGQEMVIKLADLLLKGYGTDPRLTALVNDLEIWIVPNMNPDGTANKRRYNSNWVDLNRNFPDPQKPDVNTPNGKAIEVQHMMKFTGEHNFCLSLNFHGGAVVANYLWDTMPGDVPDIQMVKFLALGYSKLNAPMYNSSSFSQGITNGYAWYEVNGGMQDWNYYWYNDMDFTIEISQTKWPDASTLSKYWDDNRESLLWFLAQARRGIHGVIRDQATKKPIAGAQVKVTQIAKAVVSSTINGDYHKILSKGIYTVQVTAPGYADRTVSNVEVKDTDTQFTILDIELAPSK